jgi:hypothetical protein
MIAGKSWRFWLGWFLVFVLLAALGVFGKYLFEQKRIHSRLEAMIAQQDRDHPGWRFADIQAARENIPPAENAALQAQAVKRALAGAKVPDVNLDPSRSHPNHRLPPSLIKELRDKLDPLKPALVEARKLVRFHKGRFAISYPPDPLSVNITPFMDVRDVPVLLRYDALARAEAGDLGGAAESCRAALHAARAIGDEPLIIALLVRAACVEISAHAVKWMIGQGELPLDELAALQASLEEENRFPLLLVAMRGERAYAHQVLEQMEKKELSDKEIAEALEIDPRKVLGLLSLDVVRELHADLLPYWGRLVDIARVKPHERARLINDLFDEIERGSPAVAKNLPAPRTIEQADRRRLAYVRCTAAALAAERYRRTKGKWPTSADDLRDLADPEALIDPHDGKPLRFKKMPDGLAIYSVGIDGVDDGGAIDAEIAHKKGGDWGVRLWNPDQRGLPPAPEPPPPPPDEPPPP